MKNIFFRNRFLLILSLILIVGCSKDFESINTDPEHASAEDMNFNYLFTSAELITSGNSDGNSYEDWRNNLRYAAVFLQHLASTSDQWPGDKYIYREDYNNAYWTNHYPSPVKNIVEVLTRIKDDPNQSNFYNIARIFRVYIFQVLTDMYGDLPYFDAGLGFYGTTNPAYDSQEDVYKDMLNELKDAAEALNSSNPNTIGNADILYQGDINKWKKFAYSEMVRLAMRMTKISPEDAENWVKTAVQGGVMQSNDDNAIIHHDAGHSRDPISNGNGWVLDGVDPNASRMGATFINFLKSTNDPRLRWISTLSSNPSNIEDLGDTAVDKQLGQPNGYDNTGGPRDISTAPGYPGNMNLYSIVNRYTYSRLDAPSFFVTHGETQLLLAEAAERTWITDKTAEEYFDAGVTASILQLNQTGGSLSQAEVDAYLTANPYTNGEDGIRMINEQYWVVTFMDEYESWANWRRSGYPVLTPVNYPGNSTNGTIPRRFTYPINEATNNADNYNSAVSRLSDGDKMTSRVWWDKP